MAEARLEDAKLNLNRVNDIFEEVTRQMNSLKRQAAKAERYAKLRDEMRAKLRVVLASKFTQLDQESAEIDGQLNALAEEMQQRSEAVQQLESENNERTQRGYAIDGELRQNRERLNQVALEIDRSEARRRTNEERCAELVARSASSDAELAQARNRLGALEEELSSNQQILESAAADLAAAQHDQARLVLQRHHAFMRQGLALWRHEHDTRRRQTEVDLPLFRSGDCRGHRHHPGFN